MTSTLESIPQTEHAIQLVGPDKLVLNTTKPVPQVGPHQVLVRIEAVGLCFSDLKLLKQFSAHPRKQPVESGIDQSVLGEIPSYVPGEKPTVPGHEGAARIVAVGDQVKNYKLGERVLIQTDYRTLLTHGGNASFGYNFEGALQEYVLMDERVIIEPGTHERFLLPASEELSASAIGLAEPWACVENSYATGERQTIKAGGQLLVVADHQRRIKGLEEAFSPDGQPATIGAICADEAQFVALEAFGAQALELDAHHVNEPRGVVAAGASKIRD
jgi:NADPH:quinone reductase-like Zn-dependent oxidoreductase